MTNTNKPLNISPSPRFYRAEQILNNQNTVFISAAPIDEDSGKQLNVTKGETGGPKGPDPTRYGDWERNGRCIDF